MINPSPPPPPSLPFKFVHFSHDTVPLRPGRRGVAAKWCLKLGKVTYIPRLPMTRGGGGMSDTIINQSSFMLNFLEHFGGKYPATI